MFPVHSLVERSSRPVPVEGTLETGRNAQRVAPRGLLSIITRPPPRRRASGAMNHSAALAAASASAADCMKSPRSVAAQQNQRYTLKDPQAVHDAGSASMGFFTTALRPKLPAQTPRARRRPPNWPQTSKAFPPPPSLMASTAHDPPEPCHDRIVMQAPTAALSAAAGGTRTGRRKPILPQRNASSE